MATSGGRCWEGGGAGDLAAANGRIRVGAVEYDFAVKVELVIDLRVDWGALRVVDIVRAVKLVRAVLQP